MKRPQLLVLVLGSVIGLPSTTPGVQRYASPISVNTGCAREVLFGRLVVTDAPTGGFVLQGQEREFHAPAGVDVSAFDGALVRIDFDKACTVRTILRAERLEGPAIEA